MLADQVTLIQQLQHRVRNFKRRRDYLWNWSCDICGDSIRDNRKARFYVGKEQGNLVCHCHNCGYSASFINYIRYMHPDLAKELTYKNFKTEALSMFNYDDIINSNDDDILVHLFYINKYNIAKQWLQYLSNKKILLTKKSASKLYNIFKQYHQK